MVVKEGGIDVRRHSATATAVYPGTCWRDLPDGLYEAGLAVAMRQALQEHENEYGSTLTPPDWIY